MSAPANAREARLVRRFDKLTSGDAQLLPRGLIQRSLQHSTAQT